VELNQQMLAVWFDPGVFMTGVVGDNYLGRSTTTILAG
jgi:hypothetical protein